MTIRGRKKVSPPSANSVSTSGNSSVLALHTSFEDIDTPEAAVASKSGGQVWALHDTGATHHLFNDIRLFDKPQPKSVNNSNKRLKLAGGDVSLAVHSEGSVRLKAGNGSIFELKDCLYVPELSKNLIAGGRLRLKGVREYFDDGDNQKFSLVLNGLALFNGYIGTNGLMNIAIDPVSHSHLCFDVKINTDNHSLLTHQRLGHIGNKYLRLMCHHESVDGMKGSLGTVKNCYICSLTKNTQLPYNHSRPRATRFLENIHVDLSGIM